MTDRDIQRRLRILTAWAVGSTVLSGSLLVAAFVEPTSARAAAQADHAVLRVERLEIVEPDGAPTMILANSRRLPGPIFGGEELPPEFSQGRVGSAGMLFYGSRGDEVGGLTYRVDERGDIPAAFGGLMFDQYRQDQVVGIQYAEGPEGRSAGLRVWDRSAELPLEDLVDLVVARGGEGPEAARASERLQELAVAGELGAPRVFVGSQDRVAHVTLRDTMGRPRLRLVVDDQDVARLEFLDEAGEVVMQVPE